VFEPKRTNGTVSILNTHTHTYIDTHTHIDADSATSQRDSKPYTVMQNESTELSSPVNRVISVNMTLETVSETTDNYTLTTVKQHTRHFTDQLDTDQLSVTGH